MNTLLLRRKWTAYGFIVLLLLPLLAGLLGIGKASEATEQRKFSRWPALPESFYDLMDYPGEIDKYVTDKFGLKRFLVFIPRLMYCLTSGGYIENRVIVGRKHMLYTSTDDSVAKHQGKTCLSSEKIHIWQIRAERLKAAAAMQGATLVFALVPDKQSIYPEYLPGWMQKSGSCSVYNQAMTANTSLGILTVDLRPLLLAMKAQGQQTYFINDTHWTDAASLNAYKAIRAAAGITSTLPALSSQRIMMDKGDLMRSLNMPGQQEPAWVYQVPVGPVSATPAARVTAPFLGHPMLYERKGPGITVLVVGDSFSADHMNRFVMLDANRLIWTHVSVDDEMDLLHRYKPKLVIVEEVERSLGELW